MIARISSAAPSGSGDGTCVARISRARAVARPWMVVEPSALHFSRTRRSMSGGWL